MNSISWLAFSFAVLVRLLGWLRELFAR